MQLPHIVLFQVVNIFFNVLCASAARNDTGHISSVFEAFGYSPVCVASALTSCELSSDKVFSLNVVDLFQVIKSLTEEIKLQRENSLSEIKALRQELKMEFEKERKNNDALWNQIVNVTNSQSELKTFLQEAMLERKNTKKSQSENKIVLQEVKMELEKQRKNCECNKFENVTSSLSDIKAVLGEVKTERENVSSSLSKELAITVHDVKQNSETLTAIMATLEKMGPRTNCADLRLLGDTESGTRTLYPYGYSNQKPLFKQTAAYCDQQTDEGGWTVIQNREDLPVRENFSRSWQEYVRGFGDLKGEFWLGLDNIHALTSSTKMELRVDLELKDGVWRWAKYGTFNVGDAASKYVLRIGGYSGNAGDTMTYNHKDWNLNGMKFSTPEQDNDLAPSANCAKERSSGWWFNYCGWVNLNQQTIIWHPTLEGSYSYKTASMKIRPVSYEF